MIIDSHLHLSTETAERRYFPPRQNWHICMNWAYGAGPPYSRDPSQLNERQGLRIADPEGTYTISSMDHAGVDASIILSIDYDFAFGQEADITPEQKHVQLAELQRKYPGRLYGFAGVDPRRTGAREIFSRAIKEYGLKGFKLIPGCGHRMASFTKPPAMLDNYSER